jgi:tetratricopeptide (TPR) repeat protein
VASARTQAASPEHALAAYELETAALHFQIKRLLGDAPNRGRALSQCADCAQLLSEFRHAFAAGRAAARERLQVNAHDEAALFFLGKIDLNHVWLHLGTLGRKTGWDEYWEARRSLDALLKRNPAHLRARVARAWIDYIVDTRVPWAIRWVLGGGDKEKAVRVLRQAVNEEADYFEKVEAEFGLWEMLVREKRIADAMVIARDLARDFPDNRELIRFVDANRQD